MANQFLISIKRQIELHGKVMIYSSVAEGAYDVETGTVTNSDTEITIKMYKKHIRANQYNYPTLIGKDSALFYLANDSLTFVPQVRDKILDNGETYTIDSITEHQARGELVLFKIIAVKG